MTPSAKTWIFVAARKASQSHSTIIYKSVTFFPDVLLGKSNRRSQSLLPLNRYNLARKLESTAEKKIRGTTANTHEASTYPSAYTDSDPVPPIFFPKDFEVHKKMPISFKNEMYQKCVVVKNGEEGL